MMRFKGWARYARLDCEIRHPVQKTRYCNRPLTLYAAWYRKSEVRGGVEGEREKEGGRAQVQIKSHVVPFPFSP